MFEELYNYYARAEAWKVAPGESVMAPALAVMKDCERLHHFPKQCSAEPDRAPR